jgi:hypothetical protein
MLTRKTSSKTRIASRFVGGPRNCATDARPAQKPPDSDTSVLVHDCFDQQSGERKPEDCGCAQRTGRLDAAALIRRGCADELVIVRYEKSEKRRDSIVLRREYIAKRRAKMKINPQKLLPAILKPGNKLSFKRNVIRAQNGTPIELDMKRTDARYWNTVLVHLGLGAEAGKFLHEADAGKGLPASFTELENFSMAPVTAEDGLDPEIHALMATTIHERKEGVRHARHRVRARGAARDSDERFGEAHETTGQMNGKCEAHNRADARALPELLDRPNSG